MDFEAAGTSEATSTLECFRQRIRVDVVSDLSLQTSELVRVLLLGILYDDMCMFVGVGAIRQIASEVVQYVMGKASQLQGKHVGETAEDQGTLTEPDLLTAAMDHQQHRAEVSNHGTVSFSL